MINVENQTHYRDTRFGCEQIDVSRYMTFTPGCAFKYVFRHAGKGGAEDLRKALVYLRWAQEDGTNPWVSWKAQDGMAVLRDHVLPYLSDLPPVYVALKQIAVGKYGDAIATIENALRMSPADAMAVVRLDHGVDPADSTVCRCGEPVVGGVLDDHLASVYEALRRADV